ncbi:MAG: hypothetical protein WDW38_002960 [Sanguina aurantia]
MDKHLSSCSRPLAEVLKCLSSTVAEISDILRVATSEYSGTSNAFGDTQLQVDMQVDALIFERLASCSHVGAASSEEQPGIKALNPEGRYSVVFDPLDGSSILSANLAVGTIFGIWDTPSLLGQSCRHQVAAGYAVYGPRTLLVWAVPRSEANGSSRPPVSSTHVVTEFVLGRAGQWALSREEVAIEASRNVFAPANLRAAANNVEYNALVQRWISGNLTLRYTGGMVPDVHHILAKGGGIFCNPCSVQAPPKLRLLYECAPLALVIEAAHGMSSDGDCSLLDRVVMDSEAKSKVCLGSADMVVESLPAMQAH